MKVVGIIPARFKSSRFPGKPLVVIKGVPMILRVAARVSKAIGIEQTYVATDDERIYNTVKEAGFNVLMTGSDHLTGTDRMAEVAEKLDADLYLNIQGDEPIVVPDDINLIIKEQQKFPGSIINGMTKIDSDEDPFNVNLPKVLTNSNGRLMYMSRLAIPGIKNTTDDKKPDYYKQICIYSFTKEQLRKFSSIKSKPSFEFFEDIEILRFFDLDIPIQMVELNSKTIAVDRPEDVLLVENFLEIHGDDYNI